MTGTSGRVQGEHILSQVRKGEMEEELMTKRAGLGQETGQNTGREKWLSYREDRGPGRRRAQTNTWAGEFRVEDGVCQRGGHSNR